MVGDLVMFKKSAEWFHLSENTGKLDELLRTLRSNGVQEFSIGDISLKFTHFVHIPAEDVGRFMGREESKMSDEEKEEMLYYSSGGS